MRKTFLLTSILLLAASWALAQYSSGSSQTDQQSTSGSQSTGAYSGSSAGSQTSTSDEVSPGAQPSSSDSMNQSSQSMSSQQGETSSEMSSQAGSSARKGTSTGRMQTFQGCLSEENGKFHLTDSTGTSYELTGKTANLKAHVGHEVAITGKAATPASKTPGAMSGEQAGMEKTIQVSSFKHVSATCKSGGSMGAPGATGPSPHTY